MIVEWFLGSILGPLLDWILGLFGDADPPDWITGVAGFFHEAVLRGQGLGAWVPFPLLGTLIGGTFVIWAGFWIVKALRWLWGLTPFSGGS